MESAKLLSAIIETAIDGIITIDSRGQIETLNPSEQAEEKRTSKKSIYLKP